MLATRWLMLQALYMAYTVQFLSELQCLNHLLIAKLLKESPNGI